MQTPLNILIVEDSTEDTTLLVRKLQSSGFDPHWKRVDTLADYSASLNEKIQLIFSDYSLPQFSAPHALRHLRESSLDIPFLIISGTMGEEQAVESLKAGATDYLLKARLDRLPMVVERALREADDRSQRRRMQMALRESEEKFRQLAENINEVFWIIDPIKNELVYISPAYASIWGRPHDQNLQSPGIWLDAIHKDDRERVLNAAKTKQVTGGYDEVYRIVRPDGSIRWIRDRGFPLRDEAGTVYRIVGTAEDITPQRTLEEQFRQAQKMESIGQLAGGVAHDFNNILMVIQGHASLLLAASGMNKEAEESVREISVAAERAGNLTRQLLMFSRKQMAQPSVLDLNQVVANMTKMLNRVLTETISLQVNYSPHLSKVYCDAGMMEQVLMNLAVNARDAMPDGGKLIIRTSNEKIEADYARMKPQAKVGDYVCLEVSDTGCGIPEKILPRIFEPFFTTKGSEKGTGLGLATVYGIVQQHQGWVGVYSEEGKGTTFRVYLPVIRDLQIIEKRPVAEEVCRGTETILLVEDDIAVCALSRNMLERCGYKVVEANSGAAALEVWEKSQGQIDLVLTDMVMPGGMTGIELVKRLRVKRPALPFIYTSGYNADIVGKDFTLLEGVSFLQKPYPLQKLAQTVRAALDRRVK